MEAAKVVELKICDITVDPDFQPRVEINQAVVADYAAAKLDAFPPVKVWVDGGKKILVAGHHRFAANKKAGQNAIKAELVDCDRKHARLESVKSNGKHGLQPTGADKRRAVEIVLAEFPEWSDRRIAEEIDVSDLLVANVRSAQLQIIAVERQEEKRSGKDDKAHPATKQSAADQRELIRSLIAKDSTRSDRDIAAEVGCSPNTVTSVRKKMEKEAAGDQPPDKQKSEPKPPKTPTKPQILCPACQENGVTKGCEECKTLRKKAKDAAAAPTPGDADESVMTDAEGETVPEQARAAFVAAETIKVLCKDLRDIAGRVEAVAKGPGGRLIRWESVKQQLEDARGTLDANRATHVCPYCHGKPQAKPCACCKGEGWTSRHIWGQAPGNNKKAQRA